MQKLTAIALAVLLLAGCKKKETPTPIPERTTLNDFLYLPTKDAVWKIHLQGEISDLSYCDTFYSYDTAVHKYYTIECTGLDTFLLGHKYYKYNVANQTTYSRPQCKYDRSSTGVLFCREDTVAKRVYMSFDGYYEYLVADFSTEEPGQKAEVSSLWPSSNICELNDAIINGQKAKMWEVAYNHDKTAKFFYKAYGIGNQAGLLPKIILDADGREPKSLDFTYKGRTNHFEFDIHPSDLQYDIWH